jgi:hypothetical protein
MAAAKIRPVAHDRLQLFWFIRRPHHEFGGKPGLSRALESPCVARGTTVFGQSLGHDGSHPAEKLDRATHQGDSTPHSVDFAALYLCQCHHRVSRARGQKVSKIQCLENTRRAKLVPELIFSQYFIVYIVDDQSNDDGQNDATADKFH